VTVTSLVGAIRASRADQMQQIGQRSLEASVQEETVVFDRVMRIIGDALLRSVPLVP